MQIQTPIRIMQITDMHLFGDPTRELLGVNTNDSLQALLNLIKTTEQPHLFLLTGDLAQDGSAAAYQRVVDEFVKLNMPIFCIPGNHDDYKIMEQVLPCPLISLQKQLILDNWQIILLDSHIPRHVEGHLKQAELDFLAHCLKTHPDHHAVIVLHHHPVPVGCAWLDKIGLTNANEFWQLLTRFHQTKYVIFGHVHQFHEGVKHNIKYFSTPSTCIQFKTNSDNFALEKLGPAYRAIELLANGELKTQVYRVPEYIGKFQPNAKGY